MFMNLEYHNKEYLRRINILHGFMLNYTWLLILLFQF